MARPELPNFLFIGAEKAGSTSVHSYLGQHPDVFVSPVQGANFFSCGSEDLSGRYGYEPSTYATTVEDYLGPFEAVSGQRAVGEVSPSYLCHAQAPGRIRRHLPEVKLIGLLRQPAERAFSHFVFNHKMTTETVADFRSALAAEQDRIAAGWHYRFHYRRNGFYSRQLTPYFETFDRTRMLVLLYDDLQADPVACMQRMHAFLDVDDSFVPDTSLHHNVSGMPRNAAIRGALALVRPYRRSLIRRLPPGLVSRVGRVLLNQVEADPELMGELTQGFREDILRTQELIGRDLSHWLAPAG